MYCDLEARNGWFSCTWKYKIHNRRCCPMYIYVVQLHVRLGAQIRNKTQHRYHRLKSWCSVFNRIKSGQPWLTGRSRMGLTTRRSLRPVRKRECSNFGHCQRLVGSSEFDLQRKWIQVRNAALLCDLLPSTIPWISGWLWQRHRSTGWTWHDRGAVFGIL